MTLLKNAHGSVRPYTRHLASCKVKDDSCSCPKWLYEHPKKGRRKRSSLGTPSWAEAQRIAAETLRSFDPEIAAAREVITARDKKQRTVADACQLWLDRTERDFGTGILTQYKSITKKFREWAKSLRIEFIQDVATEQLERWYSSEDWKSYADTTRNQRWKVIRSMFKFWTERGVLTVNPIMSIRASRITGGPVQGRYTAKQVAAIYANIANSVPANANKLERDVYVTRLHAFITLLLNTGCDLIDGVQFSKTRLRCESFGGMKVFVYRYSRQKTGIGAVIPLDDSIAKTLLATPIIDSNPENMPFRFDGQVANDVELWRYRIQTVLKEAGVKWVELSADRDGKKRRKEANIKQFRHTFSINQLVAGQREEAVARMLGHANTDMVRKHYSDWIPERDEAHIREVLETRAIKQDKSPSAG